MIRIADIQRKLAHLVGWEQADASGTRIQDSLTESESGITYQQAHALLTLDNIRSILPEEGTFPAWDIATAYKKGMVVTHNGETYICRTANTGHQPSNDFNDDYNEDFGDGYWARYEQLSEYLRKLTAEGVARMTNQLLEEKTINGASKQLFERRTLVDVAGRMDNRIATTHSLVGFEIVPLRGVGVTTQIHRIGMQMMGATGNITLYLFHSSRRKPIRTFTFRVLDGKGYQWENEDDVFLPYYGGDYRNDGGAWYLCYVQDDMPEGMQAINISKDWSREPCTACNGGDLSAWRIMTKYIRISPFRAGVDSNFASDPMLPDLDVITYTPTTCYGLNLDISIGCDLSEFIISQRTLFANVLQKEVAVNVLRRILHNPNANVNRNQMNAALQMDIEGNTYQKSTGLAGELVKAYKALDLDISGLDSACLACKRQGIRIGSV